MEKTEATLDKTQTALSSGTTEAIPAAASASDLTHRLLLLHDLRTMSLTLEGLWHSSTFCTRLILKAWVKSTVRSGESSGNRPLAQCDGSVGYGFSCRTKMVNTWRLNRSLKLFLSHIFAFSWAQQTHNFPRTLPLAETASGNTVLTVAQSNKNA